MAEFRLGHRAELDSLRALSVVMVIAGHAEVPSFQFAALSGVNVFFVLSGFLITALLIEEHEMGGEGQIDLRAFWRRRLVELPQRFG